MYIRTVRTLHGFIWTELPITEELTTRIKELGKEDKKPLMENGPIFEWIPGNIILDEQEDEEYFDNLINDLQHHNNNDDNINYLPNDSDEDDDRLGSREAEYIAMDEEVGIIATDDDIFEGGDIGDYGYSSNESKEEEIFGESEVEEGSDDCGDE